MNNNIVKLFYSIINDKEVEENVILDNFYYNFKRFYMGVHEPCNLDISSYKKCIITDDELLLTVSDATIDDSLNIDGVFTIERKGKKCNIRIFNSRGDNIENRFIKY